MSGVEQEPLRFGYGIAIEGTCLAGSRLVIEDVPLTIFCPTCGTERVVENVQVLALPRLRNAVDGHPQRQGTRNR